MVKLLCYVFIFAIYLNGYSQNRKGQFRLLDENIHHLLISFEIPDQTEDVYNYYYNLNHDFKAFVEINNLEIVAAFKWDEDHFNALRQDAIKYSGSDKDVLVLKGFYVIKNNLTNTQLLNLAEQFEKFSFIRYAELNSLTLVESPFIDIPPTTPNYFQNQGYIQADPGVNMQYAWDQGVYGQGIRVRNIEYGMAFTHEELTDPKFTDELGISPSVPYAHIDHGTATAGVVAAHNGTYGITGMQHGISEYKFFSLYTTAGINVLFAINSAINQSVAGDVILYEMQTGQPQYAPVEYVQSVWDATKAATSAGIHIVAAAGNGNNNLDSQAFLSYRNRGDSGALMVGAGSDDLNHSKLSFSNYGKRVNVQGWGTNVLTTGYGTFAKIGNDPNQSYYLFGGTSAATPVVASCVIALLCRAKAMNRILSPTQIRNILIATGIAQGGNTAQHIGPLPDMMSALNYLDNYLSVTNETDTIPINVFPNPVTDELFIVFPVEFSNNEISIFDTVGRQVYIIKNYKSNTPLKVSFLKSGMYVLKMKSNNAEQSKKIIIK